MVIKIIGTGYFVMTEVTFIPEVRRLFLAVKTGSHAVQVTSRGTGAGFRSLRCPSGDAGLLRQEGLLQEVQERQAL